MSDDGEVLSSERSRFGGDPAVRVGSTVRRVRGPGAEVVEALLMHLESVGFDAAPRFVGIDDEGRQVLTFIDGDVWDWPPWVDDDRQHAITLGEVAAVLARLHHATASFDPPAGSAVARPLPLPGTTWTHGDPGYSNIVFSGGRPLALIDWDCAAPADPLCDLSMLLVLAVVNPKVIAAEESRRVGSVDAAMSAIVDSYGLDEEQAARLPVAAGVVLDDTVEHWSSIGHNPEAIPILQSVADWFRATLAG
jgi:Ser/Thr protein kinase RdoA (MazF antagonist)